MKLQVWNILMEHIGKSWILDNKGIGSGIQYVRGALDRLIKL